MRSFAYADRLERLMLRHQQLRDEYHTELAPIFEKRADRLRGEIFPTIWYASEDQVTAVQHLELAGMILTAQNPHLEYDAICSPFVTLLLI